MMKVINECITDMEQVESGCFSRLLQEVLGCVPAIILMIFFVK